MAQGEQIHVTTWPPVWPTKRAPAPGTRTAGKPYDNLAANRTRTAAHCFEAKSFGVMCSGYMDREMRDAITASHPSAAATIDSLTQGASLFLDPTGAPVGDQVQGEEGIAYADLDLNACIEPKQFHDVVGSGYQRYDVFDLKVDRRRQGPDRVFEDEYEEPLVEDRVERAASRMEQASSTVSQASNTVSRADVASKSADSVVSQSATLSGGAPRPISPDPTPRISPDPTSRGTEFRGHSDFSPAIDGEITGRLHRKVHSDAHEGLDTKGFLHGSNEDIPVDAVLRGPVDITNLSGYVTAHADAEIAIRANGEVDGKLVNRVHEEAHEGVDDKGFFESEEGQANAIGKGPFEGKTDAPIYDHVHGRVDGEIDGMLDGKLVNRVHEDAHEAVDDKGFFGESGEVEGQSGGEIIDEVHGLEGSKLVNRVHEDAHEGVNKHGFFKP